MSSLLNSSIRSAIFGLSLIGAHAIGPASAEEEYRFRLAAGVAPSHPSAQATEYWIKRVDELSAGRIKIQATWGGALLMNPEIMPGVRDGRVDIGLSAASSYPAEWPLTQLNAVPFLAPDGAAVARAMNELYRTMDDFEAEYKRQGVHLISFLPLDRLLLGARKEFANIGDLEGLQIRAIGTWQGALRSAGATPVGVPYSELYESLQRGVIDGYGLNFEGIYDVKLYEIALYMHNAGVGIISNMNIIISRELWDGLPAELQTIMEQAAAEMMDRVPEISKQIVEQQCADAVKAGAHFIKWTDQAISEWEAAVGDGLVNNWAETVSDKNTAESFKNQYEELVQKYSSDSKWKSAFDICFDMANNK